MLVQAAPRKGHAATSLVVGEGSVCERATEQETGDEACRKKRCSLRPTIHHHSSGPHGNGSFVDDVPPVLLSALYWQDWVPDVRERKVRPLYLISIRVNRRTLARTVSPSW